VTRRSTRRFGRSLHARSGISAFASILESAEKASFGRSEQLLLVLQTPSRRNHRQVQLDHSIARVIAAPSSRTHRESIRDIFSPASRSRQRLVVASEKNKIRNVNGCPLSLTLLSSKTRSSKIPRDANVRFLKRRRGVPARVLIPRGPILASAEYIRRDTSPRALRCGGDQVYDTCRVTLSSWLVVIRHCRSSNPEFFSRGRIIRIRTPFNCISLQVKERDTPVRYTRLGSSLLGETDPRNVKLYRAIRLFVL